MESATILTPRNTALSDILLSAGNTVYIYTDKFKSTDESVLAVPLDGCLFLLFICKGLKSISFTKFNWR